MTIRGHQGASAEADRAGGATPLSRFASQPKALIPCAVKFSRVFAMPSGETFSIKPIGDFVRRYLAQSTVSVDPFARDRDWFTYTNDLDLATSAQRHMDAERFCHELASEGVAADLAIFDPPYSPRQISDCYRSVGLEVGQRETQSGRLYKRVRDALDELIPVGGIVLSFGWQSAGMGVGRGYHQVEILLVAHGGAHNDTICVAERKVGNAFLAPTIIDRDDSALTDIRQLTQHSFADDSEGLGFVPFHTGDNSNG